VSEILVNVALVALPAALAFLALEAAIWLWRRR
jgi:hypothetical protein